MKGYVKNIDWINAEAMRYWSIPKTFKGDAREKIHDLIFSGQYWGALKRDGYYQRIIKDEDGNCFMIARSPDVNGHPVNKIEWVPHFNEFLSKIPNGTVLICEVYLPGNEGSKNITSILGCLKEKALARQEAGQKLWLYVFDICAWGNESFVTKPAKERFKFLGSIAPTYASTPYVEIATYYNGVELWNMLQDYLARGLEGMVITREDCPIYFKRTPAWTTIKVKKELKDTLDVVVMGANPPSRLYLGDYIESWPYWENPITKEKFEGEFYFDYLSKRGIEPVTKAWFNGWAGSLIIGARRSDGKIYPIGNLSGLTEEILSNWKSYVGKVFEVTAMEVMDKGLRHPRFVQVREDKTAADASTLIQIFGNEAFAR